jgi:HK97 family phage portal protein
MLARLFAGHHEERALTAWGPWPGDGLTSWSGMTVTADTATQLLAVYGSVRLISDSISTLPVDCFRRRPDGTKEEVARPAWLDHPTANLEWADWCGQVLWSLLLEGNAYVVVLRNDRGTIVELVPVDPQAVVPTRISGRLQYLVGGAVFPGEIRHLKALMKPGTDVGISPLEAARQSIGLGLAATEYGAKFFDSEANMPGVIEAPGAVQPETMRNIAEQWARKRKRAFKGTPGVLQGGMTWKSTGVTNEQSQFLQTRQWTAAEIAAQVFLLDPADLGIPVDGTSLTYGNLADRNARRVQVALRPWIVRLESFVSTLMAQPRYCKLNVEGLLRGNPSERFALYEIASRINASAAALGQASLMTTAEMREYEDLPPLPEPEKPEVESDPIPTDVVQDDDA